MKTILVVEDDNFVRDTLCDVLKDEGYGVAATTDGAEALQFLRTHPDTDIVLLDLMMPRMDGYEFRKEQLPDVSLAGIPVIVFTAQQMQQSEAFESLHVLRKPIELAPLLEAVHDVEGHLGDVPAYAEFH